jgi:hypothetical protein
MIFLIFACLPARLNDTRLTAVGQARQGFWFLVSLYPPNLVHLRDNPHIA